jgi:Leucine Rich repeat
LTDNFVLNESTGLRSPKSLAELCTDTLCRSLPLLGGEGSLPPGLPQDVVDDVVRSLMNHSALNATTLRVLKNCELTSLSLAKCRGVTDEWLESLNIGADGGEKVSAIIVGEQNDATRDAVMEAAMDIYDENNHQEYSDAHQYPNALHQHLHQKQKRLVFHNASLGEASSSNSMVEEASCSTSSFVSASSVYHNTNLSIERSPLKEDHPMLGEIMKSPLSSASNDSSLPHDDAHMSFTPDYDVSVTSTNSHSRRRSSSITTHMTLLDLRGSHQITDKGLLQLDDLSSLEVAKLDGCFSIQGRGLMAMSMSNRLHSLSLANCRRLTDEAIINISHLVSLETLSLDGCRCLTDRSLVALASLICLKKLDLSQCDLITDGGLENLGPLECIEELSLGWCRTISDTGVKVLCNQSGRSEHLRVLSLARTGISDDGLESLTKLQAMEELDLNGCSNISSSCLGNVLAKLPKMTSLDVSYCPGIL